MKPDTLEPLITVQDVCFVYPGHRALDHVSFTMMPQQVLALVGPNGAGKTTLLRCLAALDTPLHGTLTIDGWDTDRFPRKIHTLCSYLSDFFGLYSDLTVTQHLQFAAWSHGLSIKESNSKIEETLAQLHLQSYYQTKASHLSRGLRQRVAIAQAMIHKPKILLLDEPAAGLDPEARHHLSQLILALQKEGISMIISSHILSELEDYCTEMLILRKGKIVAHCDLKAQEEKGAIQLFITFSDEASNHSACLQTIPYLRVHSLKDNIATATFQGTQLERQQLLKTLIDHHLPVVGLEERKKTLQEKYFTITQSEDEEDLNDVSKS